MQNTAFCIITGTIVNDDYLDSAVGLGRGGRERALNKLRGVVGWDYDRNERGNLHYVLSEEHFSNSRSLIFIQNLVTGPPQKQMLFFEKVSYIGLMVFSQFLQRLLLRRGSCVLMYHRVASVCRDPWGLAVAPDNFAEQIETILRHKAIIPLSDMMDGMRRGKLRSGAVAITFDDGYRDNLTHAAPILRLNNAPATVFLSTGPMTSGLPYWWDELADIVWDPAPLQADVMIGSQGTAIALGPLEDADYNGMYWRAWDPPRSARQALYCRLWAQLRALAPLAIQVAMAHLRALRDPAQRIDAGPMSALEVRRLLKEAPCSLAGHTVDHPDLPSLSDEEISQQLQHGKETVAELAGEQVAGFAYPYGRVDGRVRHLVEAAGYEWACTTQGGFLHADTDRLAIPRLTAVDQCSISWINGGRWCSRLRPN
jgi:peptidoglycan/xylan/chitin deacetylase (PgdA/CDA1 family)